MEILHAHVAPQPASRGKFRSSTPKPSEEARAEPAENAENGSEGFWKARQWEEVKDDI